MIFKSTRKGTGYYIATIEGDYNITEEYYNKFKKLVQERFSNVAVVQHGYYHIIVLFDGIDDSDDDYFNVWSSNGIQI